MANHMSEEHAELRATVRRFLSAAATETRVRELMETEDAHDQAIWERMAGQLGLPGLVIPGEFSGSGYGLTELGIACEEIGRSLLPCPLLAGVLAATAVLGTGDRDAAALYLPGIAAGKTLAALVVSASGYGWNRGGGAPQAVRDKAVWRLTGSQRLVLDAHLADLLVVFALSDCGPALYAVEASAGGVRVDVEPGLDRTRRLTRVTFADAPGRLIGDPATATSAVEHALGAGIVALAAQQVGGCDRVLAMSRDYALQRHQFGRPIGSFQVVKHMLAEMLAQAELARSAYLDAVRLSEAHDQRKGRATEVAIATSVAKLTCSEAYLAVASAAIQVHGGIGFTWEHSAHLYFKRATSDRILFGSPDFHRERVAEALGI